MAFHVFFMVPGLVFKIPGGYLSSLMVPGWFFMITGGLLWLFMVPGWFLWFALFQVGLNPEPEARSETLGTPQKIPT